MGGSQPVTPSALLDFVSGSNKLNKFRNAADGNV